MYKVKIISVGKVKKNYWSDALAHYEKMLKSSLRVEAMWVKDCSHLQGEERRIQESALIEKKVQTRDYVIALHEQGTLQDSHAFASRLRTWLEDSNAQCCFVLGGSHGLSDTFLQRASLCLSLSPMTMPHELALVVLYEQLFRAVTILGNRAYHY